MLVAVAGAGCWYDVAQLAGDGGTDATVDAGTLADAANEAAPACRVVGDTCTTGLDCCTQVCGPNGLCSCVSLYNGPASQCHARTDCCSGDCGTNTYTCYCWGTGQVPTLTGGGTDCLVCCSGVCTKNDGGVDVCACGGTGKYCHGPTSGADCCSGVCGTVDGGYACN